MCRVHVAYNNLSARDGFACSWGMACVAEAEGKTILFDTGADGDTLLENMQKLGIQPRTIDIVFLSHIHADHTGGLARFLEENPYASVCLPSSFPEEFKEKVRRLASRLVEVRGPAEVARRVFSTGELGGAILEQALVIPRAGGTLVITGCCHPGLEPMISRAVDVGGGPPRLVTGGFHLKDTSGERLAAAIESVRSLGVERVGPSHCTGAEAIEHFKREWGPRFVDAGCGAVIQI